MSESWWLEWPSIWRNCFMILRLWWSSIGQKRWNIGWKWGNGNCSLDDDMIWWHSEMMTMRYDDILILSQMSEKVANWVGGGWCPSGQKGIERSYQPFRMSTLSTAPNTDTNTNTNTQGIERSDQRLRISSLWNACSCLQSQFSFLTETHIWANSMKFYSLLYIYSLSS